MSFVSPWVILKLVLFIKDGANQPIFDWESVKPGVIYSSILVGTQVLGYLIGEHVSYYNVLTGRRSSNAVIALILENIQRNK